MLGAQAPGSKPCSGDVNRFTATTIELYHSERLQVIPALVGKIKHLMEMRAARRCNMLVGQTGTGKTTAWQVARSVIQLMHEDDPSNAFYHRASPDSFCLCRPGCSSILIWTTDIRSASHVKKRGLRYTAVPT